MLGHHEVMAVLHFIRAISGAAPVRLFRERVLHELALLMPGVPVRLVEVSAPSDSAEVEGIPSVPSVAVEPWVAPQGDLSERDREILDAVRPHIAQAYRNAVAFTDLQLTRTGLERAIEAGFAGVVVLTPTGQVRAMTPHARSLLGTAADRRRVLAWARVQAGRTGGGTTAPAVAAAELTSPHAVARFVPGGPGEDDVVLLQKRGSGDPQAALASLGLSRREAEVLLLVAGGGPNREVAAELGVRASTVKKHLEHVYAKLGVHTRTAAVARARLALSAT
jgi:DNA-binding CsgD family transcriptional regulator